MVVFDGAEWQWFATLVICCATLSDYAATVALPNMFQGPQSDSWRTVLPQLALVILESMARSPEYVDLGIYLPPVTDDLQLYFLVRSHSMPEHHAHTCKTHQLNICGLHS